MAYRNWSRLGAAVLMAVVAGAAHASTSPTQEEDPIAAAFRAERWSEVEKLANERVARNRHDADGLRWLGLLAIDDRTGGEERRSAILSKLEACIEATPGAAKCHLGYGEVVGVQAMKAGMFAAMRSAGKIKDAFLKAVELDPRLYDARDALLSFYLMAPGIMGGGVDKAKQVVEDYAKVDANRAHMLRAKVYLQEALPAKAEAELKAVAVAGEELRHEVAQLWGAVAYSLLAKKQLEQAQEIFQRGLKEGEPKLQAAAHFGLGRVALEAGRHDEAITAIRQAMTLNPHLNGHYRVGMALQAKGDKTKAAEAFEAFLAFKPAPGGKAVDDARKRLKELRAG